MESSDSPWQTMSLQTIPNQRQTKVIPSAPAVEGAKPSKLVKDLQKPYFGLSTTDICGATSKILINPVQTRPNYVCKNDDIEGSVPFRYTFKTTRSVNPLNPEYKLAEAPMDPTQYEAPKFMRDSMDVSDIAGTKSTRKQINTVRDPMKIDDIQGTKRAVKESAFRESILDVSDINTSSKPKTLRQTNNLDPKYSIYGYEVADERGTKPKAAFLNRQTPEPFYSLHTDDIEGAKPGWKPPHLNGGIPMENRRHFHVPNRTEDIVGAQSGTRKGVKTKRDTDPNERNYVQLDGTNGDPLEFQRKQLTHSSIEKDLEIVAIERKLKALRQEKEENEAMFRSISKLSRPPRAEGSQSQVRPSVSRNNIRPPPSGSRASLNAPTMPGTASSSSRNSLASQRSHKARQNAINLVRELPKTPMTASSQRSSSRGGALRSAGESIL